MEAACITVIITSSPCANAGVFLLMGNVLLPLGSIVLKGFAIQYFLGVSGRPWMCLFNLYNTGVKS